MFEEAISKTGNPGMAGNQVKMDLSGLDEASVALLDKKLEIACEYAYELEARLEEARSEIGQLGSMLVSIAAKEAVERAGDPEKFLACLYEMFYGVNTF